MSDQTILIDAISEIDDKHLQTYIARQQNKKYTGVRSKRMFMRGALAAACLALVVVSAFALRGLGNRVHPVVGPKPVQEGPWPEQNHQNPVEPNLGGDGPSIADPSETQKGNGQNADAADSASREALLAYHFGDLYLGMPAKDVEALYGESEFHSNTGPFKYEDGIIRDSWRWRLSSEDQYDLDIDIADAGDGFVVDAILVRANIGLSLPHDIKIGMTQKELLSVWPEIAEEFVCSLDETGGTYSQSDGDGLSFAIGLKRSGDGYVVYFVWLQSYYNLDLEPYEPEEPLYNYSSGEITVWHNTNSGWQAKDLRNHAAKQVEMAFSIEDIKPFDGDLVIPTYFVDFHNGTVAGVYDESEAGFVCKLEDREAFAQALQSNSSDLCTFGLAQSVTCVFPYGVWGTLSQATN